MRWSCLCWEFQVPMPNRKLIPITSIRQTRNLSHYQSVRPDNQSGANQYEGRFRLPYAVECGAKSPPPGEYPFYFRSDGKVGQVVDEIEESDGWNCGYRAASGAKSRARCANGENQTKHSNALGDPGSRVGICPGCNTPSKFHTREPIFCLVSTPRRRYAPVSES
jgi:hypothetical protein